MMFIDEGRSARDYPSNIRQKKMFIDISNDLSASLPRTIPGNMPQKVSNQQERNFPAEISQSKKKGFLRKNKEVWKVPQNWETETQ